MTKKKIERLAREDFNELFNTEEMLLDKINELVDSHNESVEEESTPMEPVESICIECKRRPVEVGVLCDVCRYGQPTTPEKKCCECPDGKIGFDGKWCVCDCHQREKECRCDGPKWNQPHSQFCEKQQGESESEEVKTTQLRIGMLRQWLNEDRITDNKKMVTSEDIRYWLSL